MAKTEIRGIDPLISELFFIILKFTKLTDYLVNLLDKFFPLRRVIDITTPCVTFPPAQTGGRNGGACPDRAERVVHFGGAMKKLHMASYDG
jgi:hypothetical protein